jgi:RNA polymerase sigma factor (TIGR02999 family)
VASDVTQILHAIDAGDPRAAEQLLPLVYEELRKVAATKLAHEKPGQTLDATALVHEAYVRLVGERRGSSPPEDRRDKPGGSPEFANRRHFFAAAAEAMRRILVDRARARHAAKRGGDGERLDVNLDQLVGRYSDEDMIDTDSVLDALAHDDPDAAEIVRLHVFGGLSIEDAGIALGLSRSAAYRNWDYARAWLRDSIRRSP